MLGHPRNHEETASEEVMLVLVHPSRDITRHRTPLMQATKQESDEGYAIV